MQQAYVIKPFFDLTQGVSVDASIRLPRSCTVHVNQYAQYVFLELTFPVGDADDPPPMVERRILLVQDGDLVPEDMEFIGSISANEIITSEEDAGEFGTVESLPATAEEFYNALLMYAVFISPEKTTRAAQTTSWRYIP